MERGKNQTRLPKDVIAILQRLWLHDPEFVAMRKEGCTLKQAAKRLHQRSLTDPAFAIAAAIQDRLGIYGRNTSIGTWSDRYRALGTITRPQMANLGKMVPGFSFTIKRQYNEESKEKMKASIAKARAKLLEMRANGELTRYKKTEKPDGPSAIHQIVEPLAGRVNGHGIAIAVLKGRLDELEKALGIEPK